MVVAAAPPRVTRSDTKWSPPSRLVSGDATEPPDDRRRCPLPTPINKREILRGRGRNEGKKSRENSEVD